MDERQLDKMFREGLEHLTEKDYPVRGWENVRKSIQNTTPAHSGGWLPARNVWICLSLTLLTTLMIQSGFMVNKEREISRLRQHIVQMTADADAKPLGDSCLDETDNPVAHLSNLHSSSLRGRDTVYIMIYRNDHGVSVPDVAVSSFVRDRESGYNDLEVGDNNSQENNFDSDSIPGTSAPVNMPTSVVAKPDSLSQIHPGKRKPKYAYSLSFRDVQVNPGIEIKQSFLIPQYGHANVSPAPGVFVSFRKKTSAWGFRTGLWASHLKFSADPVNIIKMDPTGDHFARYPGLLASGSVNTLHKIEGKSLVWEIPAGLTYEFYNTRNLRLQAELGTSLYHLGTTRYDYKFHGTESNYTRSVSSPASWYWGALYTSSSLEYRMNRNLWLRGGVYYQHYIRPQGPEGRKFNALGVSAGLLFGN